MEGTFKDHEENLDRPLRKITQLAESVGGSLPPSVRQELSVIKDDINFDMRIIKSEMRGIKSRSGQIETQILKPQQ
jgi:hypothetical protein